MKEWLSRREERGAYRTILNELNLQDQTDYRTNNDTFQRVVDERRPVNY